VIEPMGISGHSGIFTEFAYRRLLVLPDSGSRRLVALAPRSARMVEEGVPIDKVVVRRNGIDAGNHAAPEPLTQVAHSEDAKLVLFLAGCIEEESRTVLERSVAGRLDGSWTEAFSCRGPDEGDGYRENEASVRLNLGRSVLFRPLYGDGKWSAYRDADLFVLPSR